MHACSLTAHEICVKHSWDAVVTCNYFMNFRTVTKYILSSINGDNFSENTHFTSTSSISAVLSKCDVSLSCRSEKLFLSNLACWQWPFSSIVNYQAPTCVSIWEKTHKRVSSALTRTIYNSIHTSTFTIAVICAGTAQTSQFNHDLCDLNTHCWVRIKSLCVHEVQSNITQTHIQVDSAE